MNTKTALIVAGVIFSLVSFLHVLRWYFKIAVIFGGYVIPMWVSGAGFILALILAIWMFTASRRA
jgi:hypothetical protein